MTIPDSVWFILVSGGVILSAIAGIALTACTLPGIWLALLAAGLAQWWHMSQLGTPMFSWWTLGTCAALGVLAEIFELVASGLGASKAGGSKSGALGSIIGAMIGAIVGTFIIPIPVLGTLLGAAGGAGLGALVVEKHLGQRTWAASSKAGVGAAMGRLVASIVKVGFAGVIAIILIVGVLVP